MKRKLIEKLLEEFDKDRKIIIANLMEAMDVVILETKNEYEKAILTIQIEGNDENEK